VDQLLIRGGIGGTRIWPGAVWRPPPGKRGAALHAALVAQPGSCIRRLGGNRAQEMRFRRFLHNGSVTTEEMVCHAVKGTAARVAGRDIVVVQDTSELVLGGRRARANGFGPVGKGGALGGLLLHAALALEVESGALLGIADAKIWNRDKGKLAHRRSRATADKESQRWLDTTARAGEMLAAARSITCVSDRESDIYEHFAARPCNVHLIVRACQDRLIAAEATDTSALLFSFIDSIVEQGRFSVEIPAAPGRRARVAELAVRFTPVVLRKPVHAARGLPASMNLTAVDVREVSAPADGSAPVHWRLLTTHNVSSVDDARRVVALYRLRWTIEEYFRTLKTAGFDIEDADLSDPRAMMSLVVAASIAAVTVMQLVKGRDGAGQRRLTDAFDADDQRILEAICERVEGKTERQKNPHPGGTLAFAAWVIARLGGWTAYYGKPGPKVMRLGLEAFQRIKFGVTLRLQDV
jgi:Transposase DDE domain